MSSQPRIDQFFKSTSGHRAIIDGAKKTTKVLSRSTPGRKLQMKNRPVGRTRNVNSPSRTETREKKFSQHEKDSSEVLIIESKRSDCLIGESATNLLKTQNRSPSEKSIATEGGVSGINTSTPVKKTIKGFVAACNSPKATASPGKISLKRRNHESPGPPSPPKRSPTLRENSGKFSKENSSEIANTSGLSMAPQSSISRENLDENGDPEIEIVDVFIKNGSEIKNDDSTERRENESNIPRIENESRYNSSQIEAKVTPKKRKTRDLSSPRNSPTSSGWKVSVAMETPDRSMTALSTDWQKTLEVPTGLAKSLMKGAEGVSKEIIEVMTEKGENDENVTKKLTPARENFCDSYAKRSSPRRALFSPQNSAKKICSDSNVRVASPVAVSPENAVESPRDEAKISPQGIGKSTNSRANRNSNSNERRNEGASSEKQIVDASGICDEENVTFPTINGIVASSLLTKVCDSANASIQIDETAKSPIKTSGTPAKSPTKTFGTPAKSPTKISGTPAKSPTKISGTPAKSPIKTSGTPASSPTKLNGISNSPTKNDGTSKSPQKMVVQSNSPTKRNGIPTTPTKSSSRGSRSSFSPRVKYSPQKPQKDRVDMDLAKKAVDNLNQAKQGIIAPNNFDLELIYVKKSFDFEYGSLNANAAVKYEVRDVRAPKEKHGDHFFMVLVNVFSEPLNCGYFDDEELDAVFSILTLSCYAQSLLVRMLKRKRGWHRVSSIKYPEIAEDLSPIFQELVDRGFLDDDITSEEISTSLSLLQVDEIRAVCQAMKVKHKATKPTMISDLVKLSTRVNSLFPGMKSPALALREKVNAELGFCIRLSEKIENLLNRIFILLIPTQDPKENMAEAFRMLVQVHFGERRFPATEGQRFPIFRNRLHLIRYAEARSAWNQIINASEAKDWENVRALGQLAYDRLRPYFERDDSSETSSLPSHVKRFDENYAWTKVMWISVEGFKKTKEGKPTAAEFLHELVSPRNKLPGNRTRWYLELALIESYHLKNCERSAEITIEALMQEKLSEIDAAELLERARKLGKKKGLSVNTKDRILVAVGLRQEMFISLSEPTVKEIEATMVTGNTTGSKSMWSMNIGGSDTGYLRVEEVALRHYLNEGFRDGIHCEGSLPIMIFATLLWNEIYSVPVPGAFVSPYQAAPLDLYTSRFLEPRRERVEEKLKFIRRLDLECLSNMMHEDFVKYRDYESVMPGSPFSKSEDFKHFIECLGMDALIGICERLAGNFNQWKSGFPDLALWNPTTKKCKIVEVKGPGDSLSTKQRLWIQFLECLGVDVEVCVVKHTTRRYAT